LVFIKFVCRLEESESNLKDKEETVTRQRKDLDKLKNRLTDLERQNDSSDLRKKALEKVYSIHYQFS
jgi:hypothetical protein